jgi:hypothetical protein
MAAKSFRLRFTFWLDMCKTDEKEIAETIADLKDQRSFVSTVRDGIRLVTDLRAGRLDVLFELFPWIQSELETHNLGSDVATKERIALLEQMLLQQNTGLKMHPISGPKPLLMPQTAAPILEDEDSHLLVMKQIKSSGNSAKNFLASTFSLTQ